MNRVFSGYYPNNVCGVVYQNAGRYLACQFTFACEHKNLDRIDEPDMWMQAKSMAKDSLDGKICAPTSDTPRTTTPIGCVRAGSTK